MPLMTTASGAKFGKTEAGTIWLDPARTSPFQFYQFWLNTDDRDVIAYLKYFTFLDARRDRRRSSARTTSAPEKREAQRVLAREVTTLVHGAEQAVARRARVAMLFGEDTRDAGGRRRARRCSTTCRRRRWRRTSSRRRGRRRRSRGARAAGAVEERGAAAGAVGRRVREQPARSTDPKARLTREQAIGGRVFVLRKGQKQKHVIRVQR